MRTHVLRPTPILALTLALVSTASAGAASGERADDIVMFRGDARHRGIGDPAVPRPDATGALRVRWRFQTGNKVRSTPAVRDGTVYVGSNDGALYALDAATGAQRWKVRTGGPVSSSPAVVGELAYVASGDGKLHALDARTGVERWSIQTGPELPFVNGGDPTLGTWDFWLSSPVVSGGIVYFGAGDGKVYAVDALSGALAWTLQTAGRVRSTPAVADGVVYAGSFDGAMYAADARTGALRWKLATEGNRYFPVGSIQSSPAVSGGLVYFGSRDGRLYAVDVATGKTRWRADHEVSWVIASPAVVDGVVYVGSSDGKFVQALDAATGGEKWRHKMGGNVFASATVAGDIVLVADWDGTLLGLDAKTGKTRLGYLVESRIQSTPVVAGGVIYFGADDDYLYALAAPATPPPSR